MNDENVPVINNEPGDIFAARLEGRYTDGDEWLKMNGSPDEWPVAYIGTKLTIDAADGIISQLAGEYSDDDDFVFCSPDPQTALKYSDVRNVNGDNKLVIFQARVNPEAITVVRLENNNHSVIWAVPKDDSIRPYGLCCYPIPQRA
ncbi:unnamed protein product [Caenorhabditis bovis]|uniref:Uncharacterized protein n=1 Tax=Caenorhabditis bovis TaxID=2654633 RepID=A0A8S1F6K4_9PELO|nr:unnamed protein product [Caenorhabditis bovis]